MAKKVIIADDEPVVREVVKQVLQAEGYEVIEAENGQEAVEQVGKLNPDLVILDVRMPVLDGMQACRLIRQMDEPVRNVPIIILTAVDTSLGRRLGAEWGADLYLVKPISPRLLRQKIKELIGPPHEEQSETQK
ncbi:MAG TPA: response regulator [Armatimonadetes bacterium]|nr:response regulator [Armatimonadota bacterium]